jgi:Icc-related predicted phosphoesterase
LTPFKLFFTTDIHGSERCFRKFVNAAKIYGVNAIILGGDITGKAVVPIVKTPSGYTADLSGKQHEFGGDGLTAAMSEIRFNGLYPYVMTAGELEEYEHNPDKVRELFRKAIRDTLREWFALAEERLKPQNIKIYISPGNDDEAVVDEVLQEFCYIKNPEGAIVTLEEGIGMMSFGYSNPTPWNSYRELPEDELFRRLDALAGRMSYDGITVFNTHVPPIDSTIDQAPKLDATLKPVTNGGQIVMSSAGSTAVRRVIEKYNPTLGLHGHIHESSGAVRVAKCLCINPGSEYNDGVLRGVIVSLNQNKRKVDYQLTVG